MKRADLTATGRSTIAWLVLISVSAATLLLFDLGQFRTLRSHEVYVAVPAREMLETGDWVIPRFGGVPRLQKPPLAYWTVAATSWLSGGVTELTARLPFACAALGLVALMTVWGWRWYGRSVGLAAGFVQATALYVQDFGRRAECDMLLSLLTTLSLFLLADTNGPATRQRLRWTVIWSLLGLAWLLKFHYGAAMVLIPFTVVALCSDWRRLLGAVNPVGVLIFGVCVVVWPLLVMRQLPEVIDLWQTETVGRAVGELDSKPAWFFIPNLAFLMLPWTAFLLLAVPRSWRVFWHERDPHERFLWIVFFVQLAIISASSNKHRNYLLAMLPLLSLLAGRGVVQCLEWLNHRRTMLSARERGSVGLLGGTVLCAGGLALGRFSGAMPAWAVGIAVLLLVTGTVTPVLLVGGRVRSSIAMVSAALVGCCVVISGWIFPSRDYRVSAAHFGRSVRQTYPDRDILTYRLEYSMQGMDPVLFYLADPVQRVFRRDTLAEKLEPGRPALVVTYRLREQELAELGDVSVISTMAPHKDRPSPRHPPLALFRLVPRSNDDPPRVARTNNSVNR